MLLWYSQEARAYALLALLCALSLLYFVRALRRGEPRATSSLWGVASALALATHYFAVFPIVAEAVWLLAPPRPGEPAPGSGSSPSPASRWRRWRSTRCRSATPNGSATSRLGHRLWETAVDLRHRRDRRHHRPPEQPAAGPRCRSLLVARRRWPCSRCAATARSAARAAIPLSLAAAAIGIPLAAGAALPRQGLRPRPQPAAGAGAAAGRGRDRRHPAGGAPPRHRDRRAPCVAYSLGFCVWASLSPDLQRPDWDAVAAELGEPDGAAGDVTWALGEALAALLPLDRGDPGHARRRLRLAGPRSRLRLRRAGAAAAAPACSAPASAKPAHEQVGPPLHPPLRAARPGPGAAAAARSCATPSSTSATTGSSSTASGRAEHACHVSRVESYPERHAAESSEEKA